MGPFMDGRNLVFGGLLVDAVQGREFYRNLEKFFAVI